MIFDLHVHTTLSKCSKLDMGQILSHAQSFGLDGVCITDHDTMETKKHFKQGVQKDGLCLITGMEYTTEHGDFLVFGPFDGLPSGLSDTRLIETVDRLGGVAVAAHPYRKNRQIREKIFKEDYCHVAEAINGRNSDPDNRQVEKLREQFDFTEVGGSDAHSLKELGRVVTCFDQPVQSEQDLVNALKNGGCSPAWNYMRNCSRQ